jgi:hypothetical protein
MHAFPLQNPTWLRVSEVYTECFNTDLVFWNMLGLRRFGRGSSPSQTLRPKRLKPRFVRGYPALSLPNLTCLRVF